MALSDTPSADGDVLGFENDGDWAIDFGTFTTTLEPGEHGNALAVQGNGYRRIRSVPLSSPFSAGETVTLRFKTETAGWHSVEVILVKPSSGLWWQSLGTVALPDIPVSGFSQAAFDLPSATQELLMDEFSDLEVLVAVNGVGTVTLDSLAFGSAGSLTEADQSSNTVRFTLPPLVDVGAVTLGSQSELRIGDGQVITSGIVNFGGGELNIGADASVPNLWSVGPVFLRTNASVDGNVLTTQPLTAQTGVSVQGGVIDNARLTPGRTWSWQFDPPDILPAGIAVSGGSVADLPEGGAQSAVVYSGAELRIPGGTHFVATLQLEPNSVLHVDSSETPVVLYVTDSMLFKGAVSHGGPSSNFLIVYLGETPTSLESDFSGAVVAPNAELRLAPERSYRGQFIAHNLNVEARGTVTHEEFGHWPTVFGRAPDAADPISRAFPIVFPSPPGGSPGDVVASGETITLAGEIDSGNAAPGTVLVGSGGADIGGATVGGPIFSAGPVTGNTDSVGGGVIAVNEDFESVSCTTVFAPPPVGDLLLDDGRSRILFPGDYAKVRVEPGGKLYLRDGIYHFSSLELAAGAEVLLGSAGGVTQVFVSDVFSSAATVSQLGSGRPASLFVGYAGETTLELGGGFVGSLYAPHAEVLVTGNIVGSVLASTLDVQAGGSITHSPVPFELVCGVPRATSTFRKSAGDQGAPQLLAEFDNESGVSIPGSYSPAECVNFKIPTRLPVQAGNAGNHPATLTFSTEAGNTVTCSYVGGADVPHPVSRLQLAKGLEYQLNTCDDPDIGAGDEVCGTDFTLSIQGDAEFPDQSTLVAINVNTDLCQPSLGSFIPPGEAIQLLEDFGWAQTEPLEEENPDGTPSLYYATAFVKDDAQRNLLDQLLIHNQPFPVFHTEFPPDVFGRCGPITSGGDPGGEWQFVVIPGAVYNRIRELIVDTSINVEGDRMLFDAIVLRDAPPAAVNANGSLNYSALRDAGFQYRLAGTIVSALPDDDALTVTSLQGSGAAAAFVDAFEFVQDVAIEVVGKSMEGLAWLSGLLSGTVPVHVDLDIRNPDNRFAGAMLQRSWGPEGGEEQSIPGASVNLFQVQSRLYTLGLPIPTLYTSSANRAGQVDFDVAQNNFTGVTLFGGLCVTAENRSARLAQFLIPEMWCDFPDAEILEGDEAGTESSIITGFSEASEIAIDVESLGLQVLAEITEGAAYARQLVGPPLEDFADAFPPRAHVLLGPVASAVSFRTAPWAGCFRVTGFEPTDAADVQTALGALTGAGAVRLVTDANAIFSGYFLAAGANDIFIPLGGNIPNSRGITTHEYGHFVFCSLLAEQTSFLAPGGAAPRAELFTKLFAQVVLSGDPAPDNDAATINEGFADFFAGQVLGAVDYFDPPGAEQGNIAICENPALFANQCLDVNCLGQENNPRNPEIARMATTLHDVFDGHYSNAPAASLVKTELLPTNGDSYAGTPLQFTAAAYGDQVDEPVALGGNEISEVTRHFLERTQTGIIPSPFSNGAFDFNADALRAAIVDTMQAAGVNWCDVCRVMAPHEDQGVTGIAAIPGIDLWNICAPLDFMNAPPRADLAIDEATCTACPPGERREVVAGVVECSACPLPRQVPDPTALAGTQGCVDCPVGSVAVDGECIACEGNEITAANTCVDCPPNLVPDAARTNCVACPNDVVLDLTTQACPVAALTATSATMAPADLCPDEFWIGVVPSPGSAMSIVSDVIEDPAACTATALNGEIFDAAANSIATFGGLGQTCAPLVCGPADPPECMPFDDCEGDFCQFAGTGSVQLEPANAVAVSRIRLQTQPGLTISASLTSCELGITPL